MLRRSFLGLFSALLLIGAPFGAALADDAPKAACSCGSCKDKHGKAGCDCGCKDATCECDKNCQCDKSATCNCGKECAGKDGKCTCPESGKECGCGKEKPKCEKCAAAKAKADAAKGAH